MFKHSIFSLPFIFIAMVVASNGWFGWRLLFLGLIEAVSARNFAMGVNRYLDRDIDKLNLEQEIDHQLMEVYLLLQCYYLFS